MSFMVYYYLFGVSPSKLTIIFKFFSPSFSAFKMLVFLLGNKLKLVKILHRARHLLVRIVSESDSNVFVIFSISCHKLRAAKS